MFAQQVRFLRPKTHVHLVGTGEYLAKVALIVNVNYHPPFNL